MPRTPRAGRQGDVLALGGQRGAPRRREGWGVSRSRKGVSFLAGRSEVSHWCVVISDLGFHPCGSAWPAVGAEGRLLPAWGASGRVAWPRHTAPLVGTVPLSRGPRALPGAAAPPSSRSVGRPCPLAILWESVAWGQGRGRRRLQGSRGPGPRLATPPAAGDLALPQDTAHLGVLTRETGADARGGGRLAEPCFLCLSRRRGSSRAALHAASGPGKLLRCGAFYS